MRIPAALLVVCLHVAYAGEGTCAAGDGDVSCSGISDAGAGQSPLHAAAQQAGCNVGSAEHMLEVAATVACIFETVFPAGDGRSPESRETSAFVKEPELGHQGLYGELMESAVETMLRTPVLVGEGALGVHDSFWDLGSGAGRVVLQAALTTKVGVAHGIELSVRRHEIAQQAVAALDNLVWSSGQGRPQDVPSRWQVHQGDLRDVLRSPDFASATAIFMNSIAFPKALLFDLAHALTRLPPGALVFSTKELPGCHRGLSLLDLLHVESTWNKRTGLRIYVVAPGTGATVPSPMQAPALAARAAAAQKLLQKRGRRWHGNREAGDADDVARCHLDELLALSEAREEALRQGALAAGADGKEDVAMLASEALRYAINVTAHGWGATDTATSRCALHTAAIDSSRGVALALQVDKGAVHSVDNEGSTPLHVCHHPDACEALLNAGADLEARNLERRTPLLSACDRCEGFEKGMDCTRVVSFLLERGAQVDVADAHGATPMHYAMHWGAVSLAASLLRAGGAEAALVQRADSEGDTPLHQLCAGVVEHGDVRLTQVLLAEESPRAALVSALAAKNAGGQTPGETCRQAGRPTVLQEVEAALASEREV
eukprot:gnl/TRDRNA2_/TRDRNA2_135001_c0_seq1.p1 gnl/TRDRNA2_/TRDRNA2_135001_c0~~gnl/TRDRNA2_/TRDRNA2_135001_c0_seq1.p1  ORF type:complete len:604 (+),score=96.90 gnl/TRDRNA2_/TRDRNA2_135001_c0_seq1:57-1868(+)